MKKSKHEEHILNSFKALVTQAPFSPASFGLFSHPSSAASMAKRPQVHGESLISKLLRNKFKIYLCLFRVVVSAFGDWL